MHKASSDDALRKQEALTYLRELKERLKNKKDTYDEFLEIMKEFKAQRCASGPNVLFFLVSGSSKCLYCQSNSSIYLFHRLQYPFQDK